MTRVVKTTVEFEGKTANRFSLVDDVPLEFWSGELRQVGRPRPRVEGTEKVTGGARYTSDVDLPGLLWARVLRCPHPRAHRGGTGSQPGRGTGAVRGDRPMASVVALLTPLGHHGNLLIYGPGGYRFAHFVRVGAPLTVICALVVAVIVWPPL